MSKSYLIDEELADAILDYLSQQPYKDVFRLILQIQSLPEATLPYGVPELFPEYDLDHPWVRPMTDEERAENEKAPQPVDSDTSETAS